MQGQASIRGIKLRTKFNGANVELQIDQLRTIQILLNLISNAIKFSPDSGSIEIECSNQPKELGLTEVEISVVDHGIGISEEDQK